MAAKPVPMENLTTEELRERLALVTAYRGNLEAIRELDAPNEDDIAAAARYRADLEAIRDDLDAPKEDDITAAAGYPPTLRQSRNLMIPTRMTSHRRRNTAPTSKPSRLRP